VRLQLDYDPGDRVYYAKKLRLGAEVRSGLCTEIIVRRDGAFARIENHGLAPVDAVFSNFERAQAACQAYNGKLQRSGTC